MNNPSSIGILGGTFDPVHWGHIKIAEQIIEHLALQRIHFLPNKVPPHRSQPLADIDDRVNMIKYAIAEFPQFVLDNTEISRGGYSYMIDTLKILRQRFPDTPLSLIMGADAFESFNTWHDWQDIPNFAHLIIMNRPELPNTKTGWMGDILRERCTQNPKELTQKLAGCIYELRVDPIDISATSIRGKLKHQQSIAHEVPDKVFNYINDRKLYRDYQ
jgi:nicotinate-nucleotide adenylyltransferase